MMIAFNQFKVVRHVNHKKTKAERTISFLILFKRAL